MDSLWVSSPDNSSFATSLEGDFYRASATLTWMIVRSITSDCNTLDNKITALLQTLGGFVRDVREARSDVDAVSRELYSLQTVLDLLKEDACLFPPELAEHTPSIVEHCSYVADKLNALLSVINSSELTPMKKRTRWLQAGRSEAAGFRTSLEAHKAVIGFALDLVGATTIRDQASDSDPSKRNTFERRQISSDVVTDISRILIQMGQVHVRLPSEFERKDGIFSLHEYMGHLKSYAEIIIRNKEVEHEAETEVEHDPSIGGKESLGTSVGDGPDSAIDVDADHHYQFTMEEVQAQMYEELSTIEVVDETDFVSSRPPTPPPRNIGRLERLEATRNRMVSPFEEETDPPSIPYGVTTEISSSRKFGFAPSIRSVRPKGFGRLFSHFRNNSVTDIRPSTQSTNTSADATGEDKLGPVVSKPASRPPSIVRRNSRRLSASIMKMPWRGIEHVEELDEAGQPVSEAVFGVSLQASMRVAKGTSKTHHNGGGGSSRREFPLCMQKCCFFLKNEDAARAPDIFAEPGDLFRVAKLKEIFSTGPSYGEHVDWTHYSVYDCADLIMLYLSQLSKPLIPESIARKWISLSRQATLSGSHGTRLDQCIDFWEEALGGLRGPSRSLFKLLLNLWADVAAAEDINDMTAERLAGVVLKPLMHIHGGPNRTDYMLSLAFLIRKRTQYTELMNENRSAINRIDRAAW
ncbi:Rho GTPase activation protein [Xylariaceae sp. FL1019]|nr:Rho GTPase activation protein [Xylariaceae sp. FL1019]